MEKLGTYIEKSKQTTWLNKNDYVDKEQQFEIVEVGKNKEKIALKLAIPNSDDEGSLFEPNQSILNGLIDLFGNNPNEWCGELIDLEFKEFVPREGQTNVSKGVSTKLITVSEEKVAA